MKKKVFLIVSLCMLVLGLAACGEDPKKVDYNGVSYDQLESNSEYIATTLVSLPEDEIDGFIEQNQNDSITFNLVTRWKELKPELGEYVALGEFAVDKSGKTLTTTHIMDFEKRDVTLTFVYNYMDMQISDITLDENFSLGEKMQKAAMNTLMGLGTVFGILILISLIIWSFKIINVMQDRAKAAQAPAEEPKPQPVAEAAPAVEAPQEDGLELIAVISAAVAAATGSQPGGTDGFVVRSIRRRK